MGQISVPGDEMMYLQINDKYRIAGDKRQWMIQTEKMMTDKKTKVKALRWVSESYFTTLESAVNELAARQLRTCAATNVLEALGELRVITKELTDALTPHFTVESK